MFVLVGAPLKTEILVLASWGVLTTVGPQGREAAEARVSRVGTLPAYICPHKFRMDFLIPKAIAAHYFGGWGKQVLPCGLKLLPLAQGTRGFHTSFF